MTRLDYSIFIVAMLVGFAWSVNVRHESAAWEKENNEIKSSIRERLDSLEQTKSTLNIRSN